MRVIPVIDIKDGIAVHARRGARAAYLPLESPLAVSPDPVAVVDGILSRWALGQVYVADLDAIAGHEGNGAAVRRIAHAHPDLRIWLDGGFRDARAVGAWLPEAAIDIVLATETLADTDTFVRLRSLVSTQRLVLSLDRSGDGRLGLASLFEAPELWPERVIHMNLARVGAGDGPDWDGLANLQRRAPHCRVYAAGGVRDDADLVRLEEQGVAGALVATALHAGTITNLPASTAGV